MKFTKAADEMAAGNFAIDIPAGADGETGRLGASLLSLAAVLQHKFDEIALLSQLTEKANMGLTLIDVLNHIYESFRAVIPYDRLGFSLLEEDGKIARAVWIRSEQTDKNIDTGYAARMEGSSLQQIVDSGRPRFLNDLGAYLRDHPESESTRRIVADGVLSSLTCPLFSQGKPIGFIFFSSAAPNTYNESHAGFFMQIANQIATIVEKGHLYQRLVELNEVKNKFLGIAAHDLRSPLAAVKGFLNLFLDGYLGDMPDSQLNYVKKIDAACDRMYALVNDLLDVSAIEAGQLDLKIEPVDPSEYLRANFEANSVIANSKSIKMKLDIEPGLPRVAMDAKRIDQVISNLISNAIKFSYPDTEITLGARRAGDFAVFYVADQGQGIPADELPLLFKEFGKTSVRPTSGEKSTGLGLSIVKRIAEAHSGSVGVTSDFGHGATFSFKLPLSK
ncbi:MAG: GAF domain-containing sensor histidine kinase [bacterium]